MIKSGFLSFEERLGLESVVRYPSEGHGITRRCNGLLLLDDGWSCERASKALYIEYSKPGSIKLMHRLGF